MIHIILSPLLENIMNPQQIGVEITIWGYQLIGTIKNYTWTFICLTIDQNIWLASNIQKPKHPQYAPYQWTVPAYIQQLKISPEQDSTPLLDKRAKNTYNQLWEN